MLALTINLLAFRFVATVLSRQQQTYMQLTRLSKETLSREKKKGILYNNDLRFRGSRLNSANSECVAQLQLNFRRHICTE